MLGVVKIKDVKEELGNLVKLLRKRDGITQAELGEKLSLSRITIQNLELGKNATMDTVLKVLQYWDLLANFHEYIRNEAINNNQKSLY